MTARTTLWNVKLSPEEHAMLTKLADDSGEPASILFRRWLRDHWTARGYDAPPAKAKTKR